jgi:hypothetical protein
MLSISGKLCGDMDERLEKIARYFLMRSHAAEFSPGSIGPKLLPHLFVLDIERGSAKEATALRIRLVGTEIDRTFRRQLKDHTLEEFIHGPRAASVIETFHYCANTREPVWMRQVVRLQNRPPRFVEGVAIYLQPERLYGGLVVGEATNHDAPEIFEHRSLGTDFARS